jgi:alkylation response protein AidB-like acyl-CoA dehydrogenase
MSIDVFLSPSQVALRAEAVEATAAFLGRAADNDRAGRFPSENFADLRAAGLLGLGVPSALGGRGESFMGFFLVAEQVAKGDASTCLCYGMHCAGIGMAMSGADDREGDEQRARYARLAIDDGKLFTIGFTEPGAGSHFLNPQAVAKRTDGGYQLRGRKAFATSAGAANVILVNAVVPETAEEGFSIFALEPASMAGVNVEGPWDAMGMRSNDSRSITLNDVFVPTSARIGAEGAGAEIAVQPSFVPLGLATASVGIAQAALEMAVAHAQTRVIAGDSDPLAGYQGIRFLLAEMAMTTNAMRLVAMRAALAAERQPEVGTLALTEAKAFCNPLAFEVANKGLQVVGGRGYLRGQQAERLVRDARAGDLMAPTAQQARDGLARALLTIDETDPE